MQQQAAIYCQCTGDIMDMVDEWQKAEEQKVSHFAGELVLKCHVQKRSNHMDC